MTDRMGKWAGAEGEAGHNVATPDTSADPLESVGVKIALQSCPMLRQGDRALHLHITQSLATGCPTP